MKGKIVGGFLLFSFVLAACEYPSETTVSATQEETIASSEAEMITSTDTQEAVSNVEPEVVESEVVESEVLAEVVEITLQDELDGILNSYCLDIAGGNKDVNPDNGLQAHTCYSYRGELGSDQVFDPGQFADNTLYMPEYDVCATLSGLQSGAEVGLAACDGSDLQTIAFTGEGAISPVSAPDMCFTVAQDSRFGRGSQHQIRDLTLETCSDDLASVQQWRTRTTDD